MPQPFQQKGVDPAWKMLYNAFHDRNYGEVIKYEEIQAVLDGYTSWRGPVFKFIKVLEERDQKTLKNARNEGYVIAFPKEHTPIAKKRVIRGRRHLIKGRHTLEGTNAKMLKPDEKVELLNMQNRVARILTAMNKRKVNTSEKKGTEEIKEDLVDIEVRLKRIMNIVEKKKKTVHS